MARSNPEAVNVEQYANETVRLQVAVKHVTSVPEVVEGQVSGSGKTISVEEPHGDNTLRLDTAEIMAGNYQFRNSWCFELYTPENFQNSERMNHAPGPQVGVNEVSDTADLPEPTHTPEA